MSYILLIIFIIGTLAEEHHQPINTIIQLDSQDHYDTGTPLFLTPYVESGQISEGRRLARVPFTEGLLQIESYAGFFTVNKQYNSNHYFWYFPATKLRIKLAPVYVWLSGGPGTNSIIGVFNDNGPLRVINGSIYKMNYTLAQEHHTIYIESPVGAGFSFTNDSKGYCTDETQVGEQLYSSVLQFFKLFPELQANDVFISGVSYGGKYAPALAYMIHKTNKQAQLKINLKGVIIDDGLSDPVNQLAFGEYLYQIGLIDWNQSTVFKEYEDNITELIKSKQWGEATDMYVELLGSVFQNMTGFVDYYNYLITDYDIMSMADYIPMLPALRKSLHVGDLLFNSSSDDFVFTYLWHDIMKSVAPWISELLDHYKFLIYNGQLDIIVPYPLTVNYLRKLNFTGSEEYKTTERQIWRVDGEVAGYKKKVGNLVEVLLRCSGHMGASEVPKWTLNLISDFTHGTI